MMPSVADRSMRTALLTGSNCAASSRWRAPMKRIIAASVIALIVGAGVVSASGQMGSVTKAAQKAGEVTKDTAKKAGEVTKDTAKKAGDTGERAAKNTGKAAKKGAKTTKSAVTK